MKIPCRQTRAETPLTIPDRRKTVSLSQKTAYPYDGKILLRVGSKGKFTLAVRIPGWCRNAVLTVNGEKACAEMRTGYAYLTREWNAGDELLLDFPMEVKWVAANPKVIDACGRVAVTRGPLVYCAEGLDNGDRPLKSIRVVKNGNVAIAEEAFGQMKLPVIFMQALCERPFEALYTEDEPQEEECRLKLIPYFAWTNRGVTEMTTWFLKK